MSDINRHLCEIPEVSQNSVVCDSDSGIDVLASLWKEIDKAITLRDTLVYTYISDLSEDPLSEGNMWKRSGGFTHRWSFNYFFYNKESKKMLFIACSSKRWWFSIPVTNSTFHPSESFSTFPVSCVLLLFPHLRPLHKSGLFRKILEAAPTSNCY